MISVQTTARFQVLTTGLKVVLILAFIVAGFIFFDSSIAQANLPLGNFSTEALSMPFAVGLAYVFFSYSGWNAATYFTDEIREAEKTVRLSLVFGVLIVASLYILLNIVFMLSSPVEKLSGQLDVAHVAAQHIFGAEGGQWMSLLISLALISSISSLIVAGPRVAKVMGEDFHVFKGVAKANKKGTPVYAILVQVSIAIVFLLSASYESVLVYTGFVLNIFNLLTVSGLFVGQGKKMFKSSRFIKICATVFLLIYGWATLYLFSAKPQESVLGLATVLVGLITYYLVQKRPKHHAEE
ncbi:MAG: amino acid permease [Okeania sp. SIO3C4]|nr:amino acid permease [Okeania sp. SIO3C4]